MRTAAVLFASAIAFTTYSLYASASTDLPEGWSLQGEAPQLFSVSVDHDDSPSGNGSLVLKRTEASHPYGSAMLMRKLPVAEYAGKRIRLSMHVRSTGVVGVNAGQAIKDTHGIHTQVTPENNRWSWNRREITLPANTHELEVGVTLKGPGMIKVDDVKIDILGDAPAEQTARRIEGDGSGGN